MPGSQLKEKEFYMFRKGTQTNKTNIDTHKIEINKVKLTTSGLKVVTLQFCNNIF